MPILQQTIYPSSNRALLIGVQGGFVDESRTAAIPEMSDGNDATAEQLHHYDDGAAGPLSVCEYLWTMDVVTYGGTIEFVRVRMRQQIVINAGDPPGGTNFQGHFNRFGPGLYSPGGFSQLGFFNHDQDMATNPQTGLAWTAADINAGRFGYRIDDEGDPAPRDFETYLSEFSVEIWGPGDPPAPSGPPREPLSEYFKHEIRERTGIDLSKRRRQ